MEVEKHGHRDGSRTGGNNGSVEYQLHSQWNVTGRLADPGRGM